MRVTKTVHFSGATVEQSYVVDFPNAFATTVAFSSPGGGTGQALLSFPLAIAALGNPAEDRMIAAYDNFSATADSMVISGLKTPLVRGQKIFYENDTGGTCQVVIEYDS